MPAIEEMGAMLNKWFIDAVEALESVPAHQKMDLRYEDLMGKHCCDPVGLFMLYF